jgi:hypothetical protein
MRGTRVFADAQEKVVPPKDRPRMHAVDEAMKKRFARSNLWIFSLVEYWGVLTRKKRATRIIVTPMMGTLTVRRRVRATGIFSWKICDLR